MGSRCGRTLNRMAGKESANRVLAVRYCTRHLPAVDPCTSAAIVPPVDPATATTPAATIHPATPTTPASPAIDPPATATTTPPIHPRTSLSRRWRCQPGAPDYRRSDRRPRPFPHALEKPPASEQFLILSRTGCFRRVFATHKNRIDRFITFLPLRTRQSTSRNAWQRSAIYPRFLRR